MMTNKIFKTGCIILILIVVAIRCDEKGANEKVCQNNLIVFSQAPINKNILNPEEFIKTCPLDDPNIQIILSEFEITVNGQPVELSAFDCANTYPETNPISDPLIWLQTLRFLYYLDIGENNYVPWTNERLYDWLKSFIKRINIVSGCAGGFFTPEVINACAQNDLNKSYDKKIEGIILNISLLVHEGIHAISESLQHSDCCPAGLSACDEYYNEDEIGGYGGSIWYQLALLKGQIDINLSSLSNERQSEIKGFLSQSVDAEIKDRICRCPPRY